MRLNTMSDKDDFISRQAALKELAVYIHLIDKTIGKGLLTDDDCMEAAESVLGENEVPAVQPESHWIPCSERLPEEPTGSADYCLDGEAVAADEYIVMIEDAKVPTSLYWTGKVWFSPYGIDSGILYSVDAWMPLPEPYKGGDTE